MRGFLQLHPSPRESSTDLHLAGFPRAGGFKLWLEISSLKMLVCVCWDGHWGAGEGKNPKGGRRVWFWFWLEAKKQTFWTVPFRNSTSLSSLVVSRSQENLSRQHSSVTFSPLPSPATIKPPAPGHHSNRDEPASSSAALTSPTPAEMQQ